MHVDGLRYHVVTHGVVAEHVAGSCIRRDGVSASAKCVSFDHGDSQGVVRLSGVLARPVDRHAVTEVADDVLLDIRKAAVVDDSLRVPLTADSGGTGVAEHASVHAKVLHIGQDDARVAVFFARRRLPTGDAHG